MNPRGFTLIEIMMVTALMSIVMGALFSIAIAMGDTATVQNVKITGHDEARRALVQLSPQLRNAAGSSINWNGLPGPEVRFRVAQDLNGNGSAVDADGRIELSPERVVRRDSADLNGDALTQTQLVLVEGQKVTVLANELAPGLETTGADAIFDPAEDTNGNGRLDRGFWVAPEGENLRITLQAQGKTRRGQTITTEFTQLVRPRN